MFSNVFGRTERGWCQLVRDSGFQALAIFLSEDGRFRALHSGSVRASPLGPAANTRETVGMFSDVRVRGGHSSDGMGVAWSGSSDPWPLVPFDDFLHCCRSRVDDLGAECFLQASHWPRSRATEPILRDGVFDRVLPSHAATVRARLHPGIVCSTFCQSASNLHAFPARETQTLPHTHSLARSRSLTPNRPLTKFYPFFTWGFPQGFQWSPGSIRSRSDQLDCRQLARGHLGAGEIQMPAHRH